MKKLGVAIIGTGNISHKHLNGYLSQKKNCKVVALCDIYTYKCKILADKCNLDLKDVTITSNYKTLLKREDIDIVSICLPPSLHCEVSCEFLLNGKNVLCEKPMAASLEEADIMIEAEKTSGKTLGIISQNRFKNSAMKLKQLFERNVFGEILLARVNSMWYRGNNYYKLWWRGTWEQEGGGCTLNHSVHQIDMLQWYMGTPEYLSSFFSNLNHNNSEVEDASLSILKYSKALAEINVSLTDMNEKQEIFFQTEKASISIPWTVHCVKQLENGFFEPDIETEKYFQKLYDEIPDLELEGHDGEIKNFINSILNKEKLIVTSLDGKKALELIYAIYKSATEKKIIELPIKKNDIFYKKNELLEAVPRFYKKSESVENLYSKEEISLGK